MEDIVHLIFGIILERKISGNKNIIFTYEKMNWKNPINFSSKKVSIVARQEFPLNFLNKLLLLEFCSFPIWIKGWAIP
jgi:hypothetical protein